MANKAFSIALPDDALKQLDALRRRYGLGSRNEAIRFAIAGAYYELREREGTSATSGRE